MKTTCLKGICKSGLGFVGSGKINAVPALRQFLDATVTYEDPAISPREMKTICSSPLHQAEIGRDGLLDRACQKTGPEIIGVGEIERSTQR